MCFAIIVFNLELECSDASDDYPLFYSFHLPNLCELEVFKQVWGVRHATRGMAVNANQAMMSSTALASAEWVDAALDGSSLKQQ